jgi:hypothetical protein
MCNLQPLSVDWLPWDVLALNADLKLCVLLRSPAYTAESALTICCVARLVCSSFCYICSAAGLQNWGEAERCFGKAAALAPSFSFAAANHTLALYQLGRTEEAIRCGQLLNHQSRQCCRSAVAVACAHEPSRLGVLFFSRLRSLPSCAAVLHFAQAAALFSQRHLPDLCSHRPEHTCATSNTAHVRPWSPFLSQGNGQPSARYVFKT